MITEDYVSFEVAKLLKEKGFDEDLRQQQVTGRYSLRDFSLERWDWGTYEISYKEGEFIHFCDQYFYYSEVKNEENTIVAPTLQMTQKWLRETYEFDICVVPTFDKDNYKAYYYLVIDIQHHIQKESGLYEDYGNCWGDAIKYCLENLI